MPITSPHRDGAACADTRTRAFPTPSLTTTAEPQDQQPEDPSKHSRLCSRSTSLSHPRPRTSSTQGAWGSAHLTQAHSTVQDQGQDQDQDRPSVEELPQASTAANASGNSSPLSHPPTVRSVVMCSRERISSGEKDTRQAEGKEKPERPNRGLGGLASDTLQHTRRR